MGTNSKGSNQAVRYYNKLVRDKIPEIIEKEGKSYLFRKLYFDREYETALKEKLLEECNEYFDSENVEELIDIVEVILALIKIKGINLDEFDRLRIDKNIEKGSFDNQIFLVCAEE